MTDSSNRDWTDKTCEFSYTLQQANVENVLRFQLFFKDKYIFSVSAVGHYTL